MVSIQGKSLLGLQGVSREEIELILRVARKMKQVVNSDNKKLPVLQGKSIVNMFWEPSTRTRGSFEMAAKYLDADVINLRQVAVLSRKVKVSVIRCSPLLLWESMLLSCVTSRKDRPCLPASVYRRSSSTAVMVLMNIRHRLYWICLRFRK